MKFIADLPDEWFDVAVEYGAPPDLDRDGLMNWDDPDPLAPTNRDNDPLLDGWYNKNMDRDFDPEVDKHGDATLEGASPDRADIPVYVYWMETEYPNGTHISSKPDQADYDALEDVYEDAPIENPDGTTGYNVMFLERGTID